MSAGKTQKHLQTNIQKLNEIINSLVEENHMLKVLLSQYQAPSSNGQTRTKGQ